MNPKISEKIDWSMLFRAILMWIVSLLVGMTLIIGAQQYLQYQMKWELSQRNSFGQVQAEYSRVQEALDIVKSSYYNFFNQLITQSFFQEKLAGSLEEQRLHIVEEIVALIQQLKLPAPATYELTQSTLYKVQTIVTEDSFKVYETKLILKLGLLHEEDLLKLIETIEFQKFPGLFNLQKCEITRLQESINVNELKTNLQASCVLAWYTSTIMR